MSEADINKVLDEWNKVEASLHRHVGYEENWTVFPIDDRRAYYWRLAVGSVWFSEDPRFRDEGGDDPEHHPVYNDAFVTLNQSGCVFRGEELTAILVDTQTDGNKFLAFFSNDKEVNLDPAERNES